MLYQEYISKVNALCINIDEGTNVAYINPDYRYLLSLSGLKTSDVTDFKDLSYEIVEDELQKVVDAYNIRNNKLPGIIDFISQIFMKVVPEITTEELNNIVGVLNKYSEVKNAQSKPTTEKIIAKANFNTGPLNLTKKEV